MNTPPQVEALSGSVWSGRASLDGGYVLTWQTSLSGIVLGRVGAELLLRGADTQIEADLNLTPWSWRLRDMTGRAGPGLLALVADTPVESCETRAIIDGSSIYWGRRSASAAGEILIAAGSCTTTQDMVVPVPAMRVMLETERRNAHATLVTDDAMPSRLAQVTLAGDRRFIITVEPAGATLIPGMPNSAPTILEFPI